VDRGKGVSKKERTTSLSFKGEGGRESSSPPRERGRKEFLERKVV